MIGDVSVVAVMMMAGLAAAGLVDPPSGRVRRLRRVLGRARAVGPASSGRGHPLPSALRAVLTPRPDALPLSLRVSGGVVGGVVAVGCWHAVSARAPDLAWLVAPWIAAVLTVVLGRLEAPASRRRRLQMIKDLPHVLELLAAAMSAGLPLRGAVRAVVAVAEGPLVEELSGVLKVIDLGSDDTDAWRRLRDHPALGRVSVDLARSVESGTMVVETLRRHASMARRQRRGVLEAQARTVGVKSVPPLVFCFVPAFLLVSIVPAAVTALRGAIF